MCSAYRGGRQTVGGVVTRLARSVAWWPGRKHKVRQAVRKNFIINRGTISFCRILYGYILKIANRFYPNGRKGPVRSLHHCLKAKMTRNLGKPWIYREIKLPSQKAFEALQFVCELFSFESSQMKTKNACKCNPTNGCDFSNSPKPSSSLPHNFVLVHVVWGSLDWGFTPTLTMAGCKEISFGTKQKFAPLSVNHFPWNLRTSPSPLP